MLLWRIHQLAIGLLIPPGVAKVGIHKEISLMHVAVHTLAGWNGTGKLVHDRMSALRFGDRFISGKTETLMPVFAPPSGIRRRAIVRINHVASRATARAIITRVIVGSEKSQERIVQPGFLQTEKDWIGAIERAKTALRQTAIGFAVRFGACGQAER